MYFWIFMLICIILLPIIMIVFGKLFSNNIPKEINTFFGYRTPISIKNRDIWFFAHNYCEKLWYIMGIIMLPPSIVIMLFCLNETRREIGIYTMIITTIQTTVVIFSIVATEKALKKTFDENGSRK